MKQGGEAVLLVFLLVFVLLIVLVCGLGDATSYVYLSICDAGLAPRCTGLHVLWWGT